MLYLVAYLTSGGPDPDCSGSMTYSYTLAPNDTVFLPRTLDVEDSIDVIDLPIHTSFSSVVESFYFPVIPLGPGSNAVFTFDSAISKESSGVGPIYMGDSVLLGGIGPAWNGPNLSGEHNFFDLRYSRQSSGTGVIVPVHTDRDAQWRFAIQMEDGDLHVPIVQYYDVNHFENGDLNCDGSRNIADLLYLVAYLFLGGPLPCENCSGLK